MCDPISATIGTAIVGQSAAAGMSAVALGTIGASTVAGIASPLMSYAGQRQQAKAQAAYQAQSVAAAQKKEGFQRTSQLLESQQKKIALAQESKKITKKARETLASATVSAGEAGVSGLSVQALMDDYVRQQAGLQAAVTTQEKLYGLQTGMSLQQIRLASEQEILGLSQPINRPSLLVSGLQAVSGGLSGYAAGQDISSRMAGTSSGIPKGTISGSTASYAPGTPGGRYLKY